MTDTPEINGLQREIESLRADIRQAESLVHLMQSQVLNYEEVDDTRRTLIEHLLAERQSLSAERTGATEQTEHRVRQLERENEKLRAQVSQEDAAAEAGRELEAALEAEQRRSGSAEQRLQAAREAHAAAIEEQRLLIATLERQIEHERQETSEVQERWRVVQESDRARAEGLWSKVETLRGELERAREADQERTRELLADLERAQSTAAELAATADRVRAKLTTLRDANTRVRTSIQDKERLVAMAAPSTGAGPDLDLVSESTATVRSDRPELEAAPAPTAAEGSPSDDGRGTGALTLDQPDAIDDIEIDEEADATRPDDAGEAEPPDGRTTDEVAPQAAGADERKDVGADNVVSRDEAHPVSLAERVAALDDLPAAADADSSARTLSDDSRLSLDQFRGRLGSGCRVLRTERFRQVMLADRPSLVISSLLERTDRFEEISALAPPALRRNLAAWLFRMYGRGMIEIVDEE